MSDIENKRSLTDWSIKEADWVQETVWVPGHNGGRKAYHHQRQCAKRCSSASLSKKPLSAVQGHIPPCGVCASDTSEQDIQSKPPSNRGVRPPQDVDPEQRYSPSHLGESTASCKQADGANSASFGVKQAATQYLGGKEVAPKLHDGTWYLVDPSEVATEHDIVYYSNSNSQPNVGARGCDRLGMEDGDTVRFEPAEIEGCKAVKLVPIDFEADTRDQTAREEDAAVTPTQCLEWRERHDSGETIPAITRDSSHPKRVVGRHVSGHCRCDHTAVDGDRDE